MALQKASTSAEQMKWLKQCGDIVQGMSNYTAKKRHIASPLSRIIVATAISHCGISFYAAEIFCAAVIRDFLDNVNGTISAINRSPSLAHTKKPDGQFLE